MSNYSIFTDVGCDLPPELLRQWNIGCVDFTCRFDGDGTEYRNCDFTPKAFYDRMRRGETARTAGANPEAFRQAFEPELEAGRDVLYLGFSSSLSNSAAVAQMAANELAGRWPRRRVIALDTRCASAGLGLLVYLCAAERTTGASLTELARYAAGTAERISHWFTVDDLVYLKRGGRVSAATALAGALLHVKPVMHMDDEGRLTNVHKVRGRRQAIASMAERYMETSQDPFGVYFIAHGDCPEDAALLEQMIFDRTGRKAAKLTGIGPVIGAHSGPGTLALFFLGTKR